MDAQTGAPWTAGRANLGDLIWRGVALWPNRAAIRQGNEILSYSALEDRTQRVARLLADLGTRQGSRVMLLLPNDLRFAECLLGIMRAGGVAVPGNVKLGEETLGFIAAHSEARVLIVHADLAGRVPAIRRAAPDLQHVLAVGGDAPDAEPYDALLERTEPGWRSVPVEPERDPAIQLYTSGSTGLPKGVLLSHAAEWWQARASARVFLLDERDTALAVGPLYHANALWLCLLPMLFAGGTLAVLPAFDAAAALAAISHDRPTYFSGTPSMFALMLAELRRAPGCHDLSSLQFLLCGSSAVPEDLMQSIREQFRCEVSEVYGLSEGGTNVQTPRWGVKKPGSCGLPMPDVEIRIVDTDGSLCPPGTVGELWSRCPANMLGYYRAPDLTAARLTAEGWLKTGDLVRADEQGYIYFCGRRDDMISVGGENVYPREVETLLLSHPEIADACVVPLPHRIKGHAPVAWVVLHHPGTVDEGEIRRYCLDRGPAYAHPRRVLFTDHLPLSGTNKVDRRVLQAEALRLIQEPLGANDAG